uniref:(California timema) hypothetical protein n=1 Tax=Timema californicum TaxID=61474 RepID=A0A7R9J6N6_TIMCA|nr:unnamed protein product [Timema californicum]
MIRTSISPSSAVELNTTSALANYATEADMGTKRSHDGSNVSDPKAHEKKVGHWAFGLLTSMKDPKLLVEEDKKIVVIKDKYPKAEFHYLILPKDDISSLNQLRKCHLELLKHMDQVAERIASKHPKRKFRLGYHAVASMSRLHLHVISDDFNSSCLKTKKHWNSFTTEFFIPSKKVIADLQEFSKIAPLSKDESKKLMDSPLCCHKCSFLAANMPKLKTHLVTHLKEVD